MGEVLKMEMELAKKVVLEEVAHLDIVISTYFQPVFEKSIRELREKLVSLTLFVSRARKADNMKYCLRKAESVYDKFLFEYKQKRVHKYQDDRHTIQYLVNKLAREQQNFTHEDFRKTRDMIYDLKHERNELFLRGEARKLAQRLEECNDPKELENMLLGAEYFYQEGMRAFKEENFKSALYNFEKSAEMGHELAQFNLGHCYFNGIGRRKNYAKAYSYFKQSAEQEQPFAELHLGICLQNGMGVKEDPVAAFHMYQRSAQHGHSLAFNNVGFCYEYGIGVEENLERAFECYRISAEGGSPIAVFNVGQFYEEGKGGVEKDLKKAKECFVKSASLGIKDAQQKLKILKL